jgi:hypothetical protein
MKFSEPPKACPLCNSRPHRDLGATSPPWYRRACLAHSWLILVLVVHARKLDRSDIAARGRDRTDAATADHLTVAQNRRAVQVFDRPVKQLGTSRDDSRGGGCSWTGCWRRSRYARAPARPARHLSFPPSPLPSMTDIGLAYYPDATYLLFPRTSSSRTSEPTGSRPQVSPPGCESSDRPSFRRLPRIAERLGR